MRLVEVGLRLAEGRRVGRRSAKVGREVVSAVSIGRQGSPERSSEVATEVVRGRQRGHQRSSEVAREVIRGCQRLSEVVRGCQRLSEVVRGRQQGLYMAPERSPEVVSKPYWRPCKVTFKRTIDGD